MFESHFGLSATPFSLNPDPHFYFQSKGHGHALSYLRFGVFQGEGFVVVTGEIGAGKTTLVRTLLSELDSQRIVAAQIVSTQLEAGDLLRSVAIAFGIAPKNLSKAELIASIEAFLTVLVTQGRRALLVVDEAQNLDLQAIEELRMLSNFQLGNHALLQSFLVGQPELRTLLTSKPMEQFRQRVIASCHLGPMDVAETRAYVEHRLHKVGWKDVPAFSDAAFEQIHLHSAGIPRRVNLLCNRLLLAAYLADAADIDGPLVQTVAADVGSEFDGGRARGTSSDVAPAQTRVAGPGPSVAPVVPAGPRMLPIGACAETGPLLCVVADRAGDIGVAMLLAALQTHKAPPRAVLVRIGDAEEFALDDSFFRRLGVETPTIEIAVPETDAASQLAGAMQRFAPVLDTHRPGRLLIAGDGNACLAAALVASMRGIPFVRVTHAADAPGSAAARTVGRALLQHLDMLAGSQASSPDVAGAGADGARTGVPTLDRLLADAAAATATSPGSDAWAVLARADVPWVGPVRSRGYCLVAIDPASTAGPARRLESVVAALRKSSQETPVVWMVDAQIAAQLAALGLRKLMRDDSIALIPSQPFADLVALVAGAKRVLSDAPVFVCIAAAVRVPCRTIELRDGEAGEPVVEFRDEPSGAASGRAAATERGAPAAELLADELVRWSHGQPVQ